MHRHVLAVIAGVALLGTAAGARAHHGWSGYDERQALTVNGVIRESGYEHPHGHLKLESGGKTWHVVLAPPSRMERRGLLAATLVPGTSATVVGYPSRSDPGEMRAERITIGDRTTELR